VFKVTGLTDEEGIRVGRELDAIVNDPGARTSKRFPYTFEDLAKEAVERALGGDQLVLVGDVAMSNRDQVSDYISSEEIERLYPIVAAPVTLDDMRRASRIMAGDPSIAQLVGSPDAEAFPFGITRHFRTQIERGDGCAAAAAAARQLALVEVVKTGVLTSSMAVFTEKRPGVFSITVAESVLEVAATFPFLPGTLSFDAEAFVREVEARRR
jgi:hypothetical protein